MSKSTSSTESLRNTSADGQPVVTTSTNSSEDDNELPINVSLFERTEGPVGHRWPHKRSKMFRCRLYTFCALHRPVSLRSRLYHYFFFVLIFFSCIVFNIFDSYFEDLAYLLMSIFDAILIVLLTIELMLRLWSSECIPRYKHWYGKYTYFKTYGVMRALDVLGVLTFWCFIYEEDFDGFNGILLRVLHVIQIFQLYRLMLPLLRLMFSTIADQFQQLYIALIFGFIIMVLISQSLFLYEFERRGDGIFDSYWFGYITLTTVGYGDIVPKEKWSRMMTCMLAFCGICIFQLPANIFGTGLAIKLKEQQKIVLFRAPASQLIQSVWRCYATEGHNARTCIWTARARKVIHLTKMDKQCVRFVLKLQYLRARRHFNTEIKSNGTDDGSNNQLEL